MSPSLRDPGPVRVISEQAYGWGSNFFPCAIPYEFEFRGDKKRVVFKSSEHMFMWHKCEDIQFRTNILLARTAWDAKQIGSKEGMRKLGVVLIPEWDVGHPHPYKVKVMLHVVRTKFRMNPGLADLLVRTGDRLIVEDAPWDEFWGTGKRGDGQNWLGRILMKVREELRTGQLKIYVPNWSTNGDLAYH